ncbi:MFS transporter [Massilia sp. W12]|uniref:MFS transporter n=1 Tax=Massilia sp. W12 TaxID=3126507 RepID=UPI0030D40121
MTGFSPLPIQGKKPQYFILLTVFLDVVGFGLVAPVLPALIRGLSTSAQSQAQWIGILMALYAVMQFFFTPILGALSDRFGRKPVLLLSLLGLAAGEFIHACATSLAALVFARLLTGCTSATIAVANSYMADVTRPDQRAAAFGKIGAAFSLGFIIGPMAGGLLGEVDIRMPFYAAGALAVLNALYGLLVLPESLPAAKRNPLKWHNMSPFNAIADLKLLRNASGLAPIIALSICAQAILQSVWVMYTETRFGWTPKDNGGMLLAIGLLSVLTEGWLLGKLLPRWGEQRLTLIALLSASASFLLFALAWQPWMMYAIALITCMSALSAPILQGLVSADADAERQGATMGALGAINSIMMVAAPLLGTFAFSMVNHMPAGDWRLGSSFLLSFAIQSVALLLAVLHFNKRKPVATTSAKLPN